MPEEDLSGVSLEGFGPQVQTAPRPEPPVQVAAAPKALRKVAPAEDLRGVSLEGFEEEAVYQRGEKKRYENSFADDALRLKWDQQGKMTTTELIMKNDIISKDLGIAVNLEHLPYFDIAALYKPGTILWKAQRLKDNDYSQDEGALRDSHLKEVTDFAVNLEEVKHRGVDGFASFYDALGKSNAFMFELISSFGAYPILKKGAKKGVSKILTKKLSEALTGYAEKIAKKKIGRVATAAVSEFGRTEVFFQHRVHAGYNQKRLNDMLAVTDKGELLLKDVKEAPGTTWFKATTDVWIDSFTEVYGGPALRKAGGALLRKMPPNLIKKFTDGIPEGKLKNLLTKGWKTLTSPIQQKAAFNSVLEEYGEERLADLMRVYLVETAPDLVTGEEIDGERLFDATFDAIFPDRDRLLSELGIIAFYGGISYSATKLTKKWESDGMPKEQIQEQLSEMSETEKDVLVEEMEESGEIVPDASTETAEESIGRIQSQIEMAEDQLIQLEENRADGVDEGAETIDAEIDSINEQIASLEGQMGSVDSQVEGSEIDFRQFETGKPIKQVMYRKETEGGQRVERGVFFTDKASLDVWGDAIEGDVKKFDINLGNPIVVESKGNFVAQQAKVGNPKALEIHDGKDFKEGFDPVVEDLGTVEDVAFEIAKDMGYDGMVSKFELELISFKTQSEIAKTKEIGPTLKRTEELMSHKESKPRKAAESQDLDKAPPSQTTRTVESDYNGEFALPEETRVQALRRSIEDYNVRLKVLSKKISDVSGEELPFHLDLWAQKDMLPREVADRVRRISDTKRDFVIKLAEKDIKVEELDTYLHALHAKERNAQMNKVRVEKGEAPTDGLSGMTDMEADAILSKDNSKMDEIVKEVRKMSKDILDLEVENGLMTQEEADQISSVYKNYVPLYRDMDSDVIGMGRGSGADVRGKEVKRAKGSEREVLSPLGNIFFQTERAHTRVLQNKVGNTIVELVEEYPFLKSMFDIKKQKHIPRFNSKGELQYLEPEFKLADNVMGTKIDGKQYFITISDRKTANALKNLNLARSSRFINTLRGAIGIWSSFKTRWRPEFIVTNFQRDLGEALVNLNVEQAILKEEGKNLKRDVAKGVFKSQRKIWKYLRGGKNSKVDEFFKEGGDAGHYWAQDVQKSQDSLLNLQKQIENQGMQKVFNPIRAASQFVDDVNSMVELGVRFSAYTELVKRGMAPKVAIQATTDMTINFQRKGEITPALQAFYGFINPAIQGTSKVMRTVGTKEGQAKVMQGITGLVLLGFMNRVISMMVDEEGDERINDWTKNHKLAFAIGDGKTVTLWSMPYGYTSFFSLGSNMAEVAFGKKTMGEGATKVFETSADSFSPFGTSINDLWPTLIKPIAEIDKNEAWHGGKIYPHTYSNTPKPDAEIYRKHASKVAVFASEVLQKMTGGGDGKAGLIDVHPDSFEYAYNQYLGGPFEFVTSSIEAAARGANGEFDINKTPFVRQFYRDGSPISWVYSSIYDTLEQASKGEPSKLEIDRFYKAVRVGVEEEIFDGKKGRSFIKAFLKARKGGK